MVLRQSDSPNDLVRVSIQVTRSQIDWLKARAHRLGVRSVPAAMRMLVQEAIATEPANKLPPGYTPEAWAYEQATRGPGASEPAERVPA